jgi:FkbM family methyltransferase
MPAALESYVKSTIACGVLFIAGATTVVVACMFLPPSAVLPVAALGSACGIAAGVLLASCALVSHRWRRAARGEQDLFLALGGSPDAAALEARKPRRRSPMRRWLARRMLGHDLIVGDLVEVRSWDEIRATLDERGCFENLPFMPEMLAMCGQRARVFRGMHRLFDYRKSRRMRHMAGAVLLAGSACDGASHGGCEAACHTIWKAAWLRRIDPREGDRDTAALRRSPPDRADTGVLQSSTQGPRFACQLTQLHAASTPVGDWNPINFWRPLIAGNVAPAAFLVAWLTHLFNEFQHHRGGIGFPSFNPGDSAGPPPEDVHLKQGDRVIVRPPAAIRATLDDRLIHRGMGFESDMLKHCGSSHCVQAEISRLIDIVSGEMRVMKTPAYLLRGVHFSGERQLFNAQYEPLFWRGVWLVKQEDAAPDGLEPHVQAEHERQLQQGIFRKSPLRRMLERPLRALGVEPIPRWQLSSHAHDFVHAEHLRELFTAHSIDCVFDVGAFNGHFGRFLREKVGYAGTILSFEPQPGPFGVLQDWSRRDGSWHSFPFALGARSGEASMNVMKKLWFSSLLEPHPDTPGIMAESNTAVASTRVRIERLADLFDSLQATHGFSRPFLKMDTQGYDLEVLHGAMPRIGRFLGLQSELSVIPIYGGMPDWRAATAQFEAAGFEVSAFFPVSCDRQLRAIEVDVVMVRAG